VRSKKSKGNVGAMAGVETAACGPAGSDPVPDPGPDPGVEPGPMAAAAAARSAERSAARQGLTLVHCSAQLERFLWEWGCAKGLCSPYF
jgi:hypothetical protein